jgi:hypothetical protein
VLNHDKKRNESSFPKMREAQHPFAIQFIFGG